MLSSLSISAAVGSVTAIVGVAPTAQRSAGDGRPAPESFAMALNQASSAPPPAAPPTPASTREESRSDAAQADAATASERQTTPTDSAAAARAATQRRANARAGAGADEKSPVVDSGSGPASAEAGPSQRPAQALDAPTADRADEADDAREVAPGAAQLLAALAIGTPAATDRAAGKATSANAGAAGVAAAPARSRAGTGPAADAATAASTAPTGRNETGAEALAAAGEREAASRPSTSTAAGAASTASAAPPATAAALQTAATVLSSAASASAPTVAEARLQASPGSADFAPALGAQLNVFLRDGVQHARLQLHPAELGPLTVQIQLDGATAQLRLAAEHPLTRQALEQAMPLLAGSLRESGLTLTGGGVFEQPANPQPQRDSRAATGERTAGDRDSPDSRDGRDPSAQPEAAPLRAAIARRGVVDLVA